jgi:hypothetical protein
MIPNTSTLWERMSGKAVDWNVVVIGAWNLAILTPSCIATDLFSLPVGTPIEVQVPMDGTGPLRVQHDGIIVSPSRSQLVITPGDPVPSKLKQASRIAVKAIELLPRTPMHAVGINLRYRVEQSPQAVAELLESAIDDRLSDADFMTSVRGLQRTVQWNDGFLNLDLQIDEARSATVLLNFHRQSQLQTELLDWLRTVDPMLESAARLMRDVVRIEIEGADA